jgi:uncharacterized membrane protein YvbJ
MEKLICSNCGISNDNEAVFCQACGNKLSKLNESIPSQETPQKISKKRLKIIIVAVIIVDLIIGVVVFIALKV